MNQIDLDYYLERVAAEELAARHSADPLAADCHKRLAEEYASLIVANHSPLLAPVPN